MNQTEKRPFSKLRTVLKRSMSTDPGVDWIKGITYSILASIIGGASKLSIRKSWLIAAELKRQRSEFQHDDEEHDNDVAKQLNNYRAGSDGSDHSAFNERLMAPLEVTASSQTDSIRDPHSVNDDDASYFFFDPIRESTPRIKSTKHNQKAVSWTLYTSGMIGMTFLNPLCCVLAMKHANPSILAPFSGLTLVWVVLFSGCLVGEPPGQVQKVACALIVLGQVTVATFGDHTNKSDVTVEQVVSLVNFVLDLFRVILNSQSSFRLTHTKIRNLLHS